MMTKIEKLFVIMVAVPVLFAGQVFADVIEDFENVSDWAVAVGAGAISGSIATDAGEAQEGSYAGVLNYGLSIETDFDFVNYYLDLSSPLDVSEPNELVIEVDLKMPNDPDMFMELMLYDTSNAFISHTFVEGDGLWHTFSLSLADDFFDYGNPPDRSAITRIIFQANGGNSTTATSGTVYVDKLEVKVPDSVMFEDFEDVSDWTVGVGTGANDGSITYDAGEAQYGRYAGAMNYDHSTATDYDYIDFVKDTQIDINDVGSIYMDMKAADDPNQLLVLHLVDSNDNFLEYVFPEGDGAWHLESLAVPGDFDDYGNPPDLTDITTFRFRSLGDASEYATSGTFYVDLITLGPLCLDSSHDVNGDCVIDFVDLADFTDEWLECGWSDPAACP